MDEQSEQRLWGRLIFRSINKRQCRREIAKEVRVDGLCHTEEIWLPWPESESLVKMIDQIGSSSYMAGRSSMREEIRNVLGIKESNDYEGVTTVLLD